MRCRYVLVLLFMCVADSKARIVDSFLECRKFFFRGQWPILKDLPTDLRYICQQYENQDHFATLYMTTHRIPLFSAYRLDHFQCKNQPCKRSKWFIEPKLLTEEDTCSTSDELAKLLELDKLDELDEQIKNKLEQEDENGNSRLRSIMLRVTENLYTTHNMDTYKKKAKEKIKILQAINEDYENTNYDRGHLNPCSYQCQFGRIATFTLTNAVPQDPCFNRHKWKDMEQWSKNIMLERCSSNTDERFFVTGVIPSEHAIPFDEHIEENVKKREPNRVNVPYQMWTAACCHHRSTTNGFSFSYIGNNAPISQIKVLHVSKLQQDLKSSYEIKIFSHDCFSFRKESREVVDELKDYVDRLNSNELKNKAKRILL